VQPVPIHPQPIITKAKKQVLLAILYSHRHRASISIHRLDASPHKYRDPVCAGSLTQASAPEDSRETRIRNEEGGR
jgi:hypothetical protein